MCRRSAVGEVPLLYNRQLVPYFPVSKHYARYDHVLQKLDTQHIVEGHSGCVNTIRWSEDGGLILSGSDDSTLQLYSYPDFGRVANMVTGHTGIIFSATFFPHTNNTKLLSGANNGMVRVTQVERPDASAPFNCHRNAVYSVVPTTEHVFYSCGGDRSVREVDLREDSTCACTSGMCHRNVLIKCKTQCVSSMAFNPVRTHEFAISVGSTVRLYDSRKLKRRHGLFSGEQRQARITEYKIPPSHTRSSAMERITYSSYNRNGSEILLSTRVAGVLLLSAEKLEPLLAPLDPLPTSSTEHTSARPRFAKRLRIAGDWSDTGPNARPTVLNPDNQTNAERFISQISDRVSNWFSERDAPDGDQDDETQQVDNESDSSSSDSESESESTSSEHEPVSPITTDEENLSLTLVSTFTGHRNTRTMIKQANFWGDSHVVSGSDCGRIFIWNRNTQKVINLLIGDTRVVNCVQPHPLDPVLATSGIDHNIKIWSPVLENGRYEPEKISDVIENNEQMLAETGDTVTIPTTVMLRVLSMMNNRTGPFFGGPGVEPPGPL